VQERLERAADHMAAALQRSLSELETYLASVSGPGAKPPPDGVAILRATERDAVVSPPARLLYYPMIPDGEEPPASAFVEGESLEFQRSDPGKAAEVFGTLARSSNPGVRAAALVRLGRTLRKTGRNKEALGAYSELARLGATRVLGLPAELVAREARCSTFEAMGNREELGKESTVMYSALQSGRWSLLRPVWAFHMDEARRWSKAGPLTDRGRNALVLSGAAEWAYNQWRTERESKGRRILNIAGQSALACWTGPADRLAAVLAGPEYLSLMWDGAIEGQQVQAALIDANGQVLIGSLHDNARQAVRAAASTGLPWTLQVTSSDAAADVAGLAGRRRLLSSVFAVLALVVLAGSYFILRSISREIAVAGLQSEFVAAVSHEFRTPLTSLRQLSEMLSKGRVPTEQLRQQSYDILAHESERLQRLVESLLEFGRIEGRAARYHFEDLDPAALVSGVVAEFREKVTTQGYSVELAQDGNDTRIRADRDALGLALWNLLDNAVKYSPDCRTVWVETARDRDGVAIRVRDHGMGIPATEQKAIFKKFVRSAVSRASGIKGTGIGLTIARDIVEAHHGEIRIESEPGHGSTFTIELRAVGADPLGTP
jgi:signal transduction histidine kinase